jgi:hypothetical protein
MPIEDDDLSGSQTASESTQNPEPASDDELSRAFDEAKNVGTSDVADEAATEESKPADDVKGDESDVKAEGEADGEKEVEGKPSTEPDEKAPKEGEEDHKERTKLGRKVAKLEDTLSQVLEQNRILLEKLTSTPQKADVQDSSAVDPSVWTEEQIQTRYDELHMESPYRANQFLEQTRHARVTQETVKYQSGYLSSIKGWQESTEDEGEATEVYKLLTDDKSPYNVKHSSNPNFDFQMNLAKATAHYYKSKAAGPTKRDNPLEKNKSISAKSPLGVGGGNKAAPETTVTKKIQIDPDIAEFARASGFSEEETAKILSGPTPMHLRRGR